MGRHQRELIRTLKNSHRQGPAAKALSDEARQRSPSRSVPAGWERQFDRRYWHRRCAAAGAAGTVVYLTQRGEVAKPPQRPQFFASPWPGGVRRATLARRGAPVVTRQWRWRTAARGSVRSRTERCRIHARRESRSARAGPGETCTIRSVYQAARARVSPRWRSPPRASAAQGQHSGRGAEVAAAPTPAPGKPMPPAASTNASARAGWRSRRCHRRFSASNRSRR
jgi:hypothetical protein